MKLRNLLSLLLCIILLTSVFPMQAFSADTQGPQPVFSQMSVAEFNRSATEDTFASISNWTGICPHLTGGRDSR
jgi:hypothetical protein